MQLHEAILETVGLAKSMSFDRELADTTPWLNTAGTLMGVPLADIKRALLAWLNTHKEPNIKWAPSASGVITNECFQLQRELALAAGKLLKDLTMDDTPQKRSDAQKTIAQLILAFHLFASNDITIDQSLLTDILRPLAATLGMPYHYNSYDLNLIKLYACILDKLAKNRKIGAVDKSEGQGDVDIRYAIHFATLWLHIENQELLSRWNIWPPGSGLFIDGEYATLTHKLDAKVLVLEANKFAMGWMYQVIKKMIRSRTDLAGYHQRESGVWAIDKAFSATETLTLPIIIPSVSVATTSTSTTSTASTSTNKKSESASTAPLLTVFSPMNTGATAVLRSLILNEFSDDKAKERLHLLSASTTIDELLNKQSALTPDEMKKVLHFAKIQTAITNPSQFIKWQSETPADSVFKLNYKHFIQKLTHGYLLGFSNKNELDKKNHPEAIMQLSEHVGTRLQNHLELYASEYGQRKQQIEQELEAIKMTYTPLKVQPNYTPAK